MKKITLFLMICFCSNFSFSQVGIGTKEPDESAALHVNSATKGVLMPRMNTAQRNAILVSGDSKGLLIFNTDTKVINIFDGVTWHAIIRNEDDQICENATTLTEFLTCLQTNYTPSQTLGYALARDILYSVIDVNSITQELKGIYTDFTILMDYSTDSDPSIHAFNLGINAEHVFPQSMGAGDEPARSDMFNLFPSRVETNSARGSCPFNDIVNSDAELWFYLNQQLTTIPTSNIDMYSEIDEDQNYPLLDLIQQCAIEPKENKKGDIARAVFYFYSIYNTLNINSYLSYANDNFFNYMKTTLLMWHINDPIDQIEIDRNSSIEIYQGNTNPFILDSTLAQRMFN